jgi:hypothetical protein
MQQLRFELEKAKSLRVDAKGRAKDVLDGVILALNWAIEGGLGSPAAIAAAQSAPAPEPEPAKPVKAPAKKKK